MKPVFQTRFGDPAGNCFAACVASILECDLSDLPDFNDKPENANWLEWFNAEMRPKGYGIAHFETSAEKPIGGYLPDGSHFLAAGPGRRGMKHCVVLRSTGLGNQYVDQLAHDPYPGGEGLEMMTSVCLVIKL